MCSKAVTSTEHRDCTEVDMLHNYEAKSVYNFYNGGGGRVHALCIINHLAS